MSIAYAQRLTNICSRGFLSTRVTDDIKSKSFLADILRFGKSEIVVVGNGYGSRGTFLWSAPSGHEINGHTHTDKPP
jgi:hypothetical protein